ncbi:hypothetical protein LSTR_LSTR005621 [Laodelphax striatellus]|uniref:Unconventional myosin-Va n=1 Tax=Laodelphax striatellus TaxID=195883 RepID=A0A482WUL0_LAOST|nr:hypothetical protein LSTR_LSTR005621 [Laodelphax striatellus]
MSSKDLYSQGARVWIPHPELVWEGAEVLENYQAKELQIKTEDSGQVRKLVITQDDDLPPLRNPDILIGENDLTSLSYLHEPAVLYNLNVRFCRQQAIYTYCGIVLVAINPYSDMPIYDMDTIWAYRGKNMGDLDPHIFAIAEEAFKKMEREQQDQSIIVSGESGAGKTVSAKYAMRYFATVGGSATETHVEKRVLASSPIMEAIGNAKTTRNDNSSRFGKFIELQFSQSYNIIGASMRTYLLEKSRVVFQAPEERNYHVFYQICAVREQYPDLKLNEAPSYVYLSEESTIPGVDDKQCFNETYNALKTLGFSDRDINDLLKILAAILHLGNIKIEQGSESKSSDSESSFIRENNTHLNILAELLQLDVKELRNWLCHRRIVSMREMFDKPMNVNEATGARDALAKYIYAELFSWIVGVINKSLEMATENRHKFIGVLDIYGFETFETNSFEQFCINYANEKLQQQFNQHVFKLEQEEYLKEKIEWKFIDFYDNQPCIDLIESKLGILDLLDEECRMPKGSDSSWAEKLYSKCTKWGHFAKPRFGSNSFVIKHFADRVEYEVIGFLEKNRDTVIEEQVAVIRNGNNRLVQKLFRDPDSEKKLAVPKSNTAPKRVQVEYQSASKSPATLGSSTKNKKTVGSQFRDSLNALMATLNATTPHYIRCIKPNDSKHAFEYNAPRTVQQLRACGVLETIRISAAGFPSRWLYVDFFNRYRVLCRSKDIDRNDLKSTCERILRGVIKDSDKYKYGHSKIFFRAGQVAYLERLRAERLKNCCLLIQKSVRMFLQRRRFLKVVKATRCIQKFTRGMIARRKVNAIRRNAAAVVIQKYLRGWLKRVIFLKLKDITLRLQTRARGYLARRRYMEMRYNHAATIIGKVVRGWLAKRRYKKDRRRVVVCQNSIRRFLARRALKKLKMEARSVEHVKKLNKGLENKIISLQQRIEELLKDNASLKHSAVELSEVRIKLDHLRGVESEMKKVTSALEEKQRKLEEIVVELQDERSEKMDLLSEKDQMASEFDNMKKTWQKEKCSLNEKIVELNKTIDINQKNAEEMLITKLEKERFVLIREQDQDRLAYQKLLAEKNQFEARCEALEREILKRPGQKFAGLHNRCLSDASTISVMEESNNSIADVQEEDYGYGSVKSSSSHHVSKLGEDAAASDWSERTTPESTLVRTSKSETKAEKEQFSDAMLMVKLQTKIKRLENEIDLLHKRLEAGEITPDERKAQDNIKLQELEISNARLKNDLSSIRKFVLTHSPDNIFDKAAADELMQQFDDLQGELDRSREECIQLKGMLTTRNQGVRSIAASNYADNDVDMSLINEDGELVLAYEAQKKIIRQLEDELQSSKLKIDELSEDNERQQKLLSANLTSKGPLNQNEVFLRLELNRLTNENLDLYEQKEKLSEEIRKLRKMLKGKPVSEKINKSGETGVVVPVVRKMDSKREYMGMFEFQSGEEAIIIRRLVAGLKPEVAVTLLPGLPAYILFMCIRHTDFINNEEMVKSLLSCFIKSIKSLIKKRNDFDTMVLWLSNSVRLLHSLNQYSGDAHYRAENTPTQNEQCFRNFDLSEFKRIIYELAVWIYQGVISIAEERVQYEAIAAILEHEAIAGITHEKKFRAQSVGDASQRTMTSLDNLLLELTTLHKTLVFHDVDAEIRTQVFKQLFYFICATCMNNLLLRKDLCHWSKGMQIRYNISHLEEWARDHKLQQHTSLHEMLAPLIQASQLLQARKTDDDVKSVCDMCNKMTANQIIKLLNLYTPADDYEERVPQTFIRKVQQCLKERGEPHDGALLMNTKFSYPVKFPFNPSNIRLEEIEIPEVLNLPMLKKV